MFTKSLFSFNRHFSIMAFFALLIFFTTGRAFAVTYVNTGLPIVRVTTAPKIDAITREVYVTGNVTITSPGSATPSLNNVTMKIKGRGNSTWDMPKRGYHIKLDAKANILGMSTDKDWVLIANYADRSLIRYVAALELSNRINIASGSPVWTPKMRYCELYWNDEYRGNYLIGEKIKVSPERVNIYDAPKPDKKTGISVANVTGGYVMELDGLYADAASGDVFFRTDLMQIPYVFKTPNGITPIGNPPTNPGDLDTSPSQIQYITDFINKAETVAYSSGYKDPSNGYAKYYDVDSVINWFLVNEIYKNQDAQFDGWNGSSVYWFKDTDTPVAPDPLRVTHNGKLFMGPNWDFDFGAGNYDDSAALYPTGWWVYNSNLIQRFMGDAAFKHRVKLRWNAVKAQIDTIYPFIDTTAASLQLSQKENFKIWPIQGYIWPSPEDYPTYDPYVSSLKQWLQTRIKWMDTQIKKFP